MDNIKFLSEILSTEHEYWIVAKKNEYNTIARKGRDNDSIMFIVIPSTIKRNIDYDKIKLVDLEKLQKESIICNIFINDSYPPFQVAQYFYDIYNGYPIKKKQKDILIKALNFRSDKLYDYKKLIDDICK